MGSPIRSEPRSLTAWIPIQLARYRAQLQRAVGLDNSLTATAPSAKRPFWRRRRVLLMLLSPIGFVLIYGLLLRDVIRNWRSFPIELLGQVNMVHIAFASAIQVVGYLIVVATWGALVHTTGQRLPFHQHLKLYAYSRLSDRIPISFSGPISRVLLYGRWGVPHMSLILLSIIEAGLVGLAAAIVYAAASLYTTGGSAVFAPVVAVAAVVCFALIQPRIAQAVLNRKRRGTDEPSKLQLGWKQLLWFIATIAFAVALGGACLFLLLTSIKPMSAWVIFDATEAWALTLVVSVALWWLPFNFGIRDVPFVVVLSRVIDLPVLTILLIIWKIWVLAMEIFWSTVALAVALYLERRRKGDRTTA